MDSRTDICIFELGVNCPFKTYDVVFKIYFFYYFFIFKCNVLKTIKTNVNFNKSSIFFYYLPLEGSIALWMGATLQ